MFFLYQNEAIASISNLLHIFCNSFKIMTLAFVNILSYFYLFNLDTFSVWSRLVWIQKTQFVYGTGEKENCYQWLLVIQTE